MDASEPVFLLSVFSKGRRSTFTAGQINALKPAATRSPSPPSPRSGRI
jgi:hypothetical protein